MKKIAFLISDGGSGSNLQAVIDAINQGIIYGEIVIVISDTAKAYGLMRAKKNRIKTHVLKKNDNLEYLLFDKFKIDYVALGGWKKIITDGMVDTFKDRILNIHPGLIPDNIDTKIKNPDGTTALWNRGKFTEKAINNFLEKKSTYAGSTVHFLSKEFDFGQVLGRCFVKILPDDTVETLYARLKPEEHKIYVKALAELCNDPLLSKTKITKYKKILIIGSGGREHALGWKIKQSRSAGNIYFAPGNGGTSLIGENVSIGATDINRLLEFALEKNIDLTVVGPEATLAEGIVDVFCKNGLDIFGPTKKAARLEWDKDWAAKFMEKYRIPYPQSYSFTSPVKAKQFLRIVNPKKIVIKASGLAAGKGVLLPGSFNEAQVAIERIMELKEFGDAGNTLVIQERLTGPEVSVLAISDGKTILPLLPVQDHKRVFDNDEGPNTGGMGTFTPVPVMTEDMMSEIKRLIMQPTINGMRNEGTPFSGVLYAGLIMTEEGPKVLEYNCRFGDPETQPLMMMLKSDLLDLLNLSLKGKLDKQQAEFYDGASVCVVLAAKGYPGKYAKGEIIYGLDKLTNGVQSFHAGTRMQNDVMITDGGRVIGITSRGSSFAEARSHVYAAVGKNGINFSGMYYRKDIGLKTNKLQSSSESD